jgi:hypothetical protein
LVDVTIRRERSKKIKEKSMIRVGRNFMKGGMGTNRR